VPHVRKKICICGPEKEGYKRGTRTICPLLSCFCRQFLGHGSVATGSHIATVIRDTFPYNSYP